MSPDGGGVSALAAAGAAALAGAVVSVVVVFGLGFDVLGPTDVRLSSAPGGVPVVDCPGGAETDRFAGGDRVYATGLNADRTWVEIRDRTGSPAWIRIEQLEPEGDSFDLLPVRDCLEPVVEVVAAEATTSTTTTSTTTTSTTTTSTTTTSTTTTSTTSTTTTSTTTTTTQPPDDDAPILTSPEVVPERIYPEDCATPTLPTEGSAYVTAHDETGIASARLEWRFVGDHEGEGDGEFDVSIEPSGDGFQLIGHIEGMPDPWADSIVSSGPLTADVEITWFVTDPAGNTRTLVDMFELGRCT